MCIILPRFDLLLRIIYITFFDILEGYPNTNPSNLPNTNSYLSLSHAKNALSTS